MADAPVVTKRPAWVRLGLWGIATRKSAMAFLWLSLVMAVGSGLYGLRDPWFFFGLGLAVATLWYWRAIGWVDRNNRWG